MSSTSYLLFCLKGSLFMKSLYPEQIGQLFRQRALIGTVADIEEPWNLSKDYLREHYLKFFASEGLECVEVYGSKVSHGHDGVLSGQRQEFEGSCDQNDLKSWEPFYVSTDLLRDILDYSEQDLKEISKLSKVIDLDVLSVEVYASEDLVSGLRVHQVLPVREQGKVCLVLSYPLPEELFYKSVRRGLILVTAQVPEGQWVDYRVEELNFSLIQVSTNVRAEVDVQPVLYEPLLDAVSALVQDYVYTNPTSSSNMPVVSVSHLLDTSELRLCDVASSRQPVSVQGLVFEGETGQEFKCRSARYVFIPGIGVCAFAHIEPDYRFSNDVWDFWVLVGVPTHADGSAHCAVYWYDRDVYQWKSKVFDIDCEKYLSEDDVFEHEAFDFLTFDVFQGDSSAASHFVKFMTFPDKFSSVLLYNKVSQNLGYRVVFPGFGGVITY